MANRLRSSISSIIPDVGHFSKWMVGIVLSAIFMLFAFRSVNWSDLTGDILSLDPYYILPLCLTTISSLFFRSCRWWALVRHGTDLKLNRVFSAFILGQFSNNILPFRAADLVRAFVLGINPNASSSFALATILVERIFEMSLLILVGFVLSRVVDGTPAWLSDTLVVGCVAVTVAILCCVGLVVARAWIDKTLMNLPLSHRFKAWLQKVFAQVMLGFQAIRQPSNVALFFGCNLIVWLSDMVGAILWAYAFGMKLSIGQALLLNVSIALSAVIPAGFGGLGVYQFVAVSVLAPFGFSHTQSLAFTLSGQALYFCVTAIISMAVIAVNRFDYSLGISSVNG